MTQHLLGKCAAVIAALMLAACGGGNEPEPAASGDPVALNPNPFPSTYQPYPAETLLLQGATVLDGIGGRIERADVLLIDGKVSAIGPGLEIPDDAVIMDASGKWITPGIIDNHSHLGVYPSPGVSAHNDGNEISSPVTPDVWAEHGVWPQDPGFTRALAGGITSMQILPGSANLFGGRGVILKNVPSRTVQDMKFPDAPYTLKMACGENPKRVYGYGGGGYPGGAPYSRMGNIAGYRADEMMQIIDISKEFGYKVTSFHHAVESYKIADKLAAEGICSSMWADWWGFKMEAYDGVRENIPMVHTAGACAIVHSDSDVGIQRLNQEAAKALADGRRIGLEISKADAWTWLSANPAKSLGIFEQTGSLEPGKDADLVVWSGDPFSTYTKADLVLVDGAVMFERGNADRTPMTDFELGQPGEGDLK